MVATAYGGLIRRMLFVNGADVSTANPLPVTGLGGGSGGTVTFPTGTAGTPNAGVLSVQGITGGTAQPVSDGPAELALGAPADAAWASGAGSIIALLKNISAKFLSTQPVSGTFWQTTQPVSLAALPALVAGAAAIGTVGVTALPALPAGTNQIGLVTAGGYTTQIQATPTVQAAAYAAGQCVGGLITLANAGRVTSGSGLVQAMTASFVSGVLPSLDIILFNANPTGSTLTDKTTAAVATADLAKVIGIIHLTDATLLGATTPSFCQGEQQAMPFKLPSGTSLYASVVTRTAITLTSTTDMVVSANLLQD
jgi:hypothetical protein